MRKFLITKFVCSVCGEILNIEDSAQEYSAHCEGEPTGAEKVENMIKVEPCNNCRHEYETVKKSLAFLRSVAV